MPPDLSSFPGFPGHLGMTYHVQQRTFSTGRPTDWDRIGDKHCIPALPHLYNAQSFHPAGPFPSCSGRTVGGRCETASRVAQTISPSIDHPSHHGLHTGIEMGSLVYAVLQKFSRYGTLGVSMGLLLGTFYYLLYVYTPTSMLQIFFRLTVLAPPKAHCSS